MTEEVKVPARTDGVVNLGARLREVRQQSGLSLREVARQLGVSASFVSQLENGKSQPSVATLYSLSQLLGISNDELFDPSLGGVPQAPHATVPLPGPAAQELPAVADRLPSARDRVHAPFADHGGADVVPMVSRSALGSPSDAWPADSALPRLSVTHPGDRTRLVMDSGVIWEQLARNTDHHLDFMEITYPPGSSSTTDDRMLRHDGYEYGYLLQGELQVTLGFEEFTLHAGEALGLDSAVPHLFKNLGTTPAKGIWFVHHRHD